jgi:hypothetical protein
MKDEVKRVVASWLASGIYKEAGESSWRSSLRAKRAGGVLPLPLAGGIAEKGFRVVFAVVRPVFAGLGWGIGGFAGNFGGFSRKGSDPSLCLPR